ncbi:divalent metal cation transporter [Sphingomonas sp. RB56-2]|uniref:Divalent metal cation transporter n=1 Tax=Sphingomonas brevis TaxID=2908206 RepID=A0ABT0SBU9_9SPHN|nr:divalent metal cation transporter [Sphingomonas brevis]MCL6741818.1 divalent metal cation transporter [Sphingomonas brevis]
MIKHDQMEVDPKPGPDHGRKPKLRDIVGPGLISGASDDDPSGIATYSQAGAQFGYALGWTMLFTYPLMSSVQMISGRIGRVTGHGIAGNLRRHYPIWLTYLAVTLLLIANTINIGADLGAMADATALVAGVPAWPFLILFAAFCALTEVFARYASYVRHLKWLTLTLLAYVITLFLVHIPWGEALRGVAVPRVTFTAATLTMIVAIFGTTISPYVFFWEAEGEAEEVHVIPDRHPLNHAPREGPSELRRIEFDTLAGMGGANLVALTIILTAAATLHAHGITDIDTSADAAEALRPIAGSYASTVFALGIVGTGLLAVPVLAGSAAYAIGEAFRWRVGLDRKPRRAKAFYGTIFAATGVGALLNFTTIDPIDALYMAAVINGVVSVPVLAIMMLIGQRRSVMGRFTITGPLRLMGWLATAVMAAAVIAMGLTSLP